MFTPSHMFVCTYVRSHFCSLHICLLHINSIYIYSPTQKCARRGQPTTVVIFKANRTNPKSIFQAIKVFLLVKHILQFSGHSLICKRSCNASNRTCNLSSHCKIVYTEQFQQIFFLQNIKRKTATIFITRLRKPFIIVHKFGVWLLRAGIF